MFSRDPMPIIERIRETFVLKGVGRPECHMGGNFYVTKDVACVKEARNDDPQHHLSEL